MWSSFSCLTFLPSSAWVLLSKIGTLFSQSLCRDGLKGWTLVARNVCLALPGCCLANQLNLVANLCRRKSSSDISWTEKLAAHVQIVPIVRPTHGLFFAWHPSGYDTLGYYMFLKLSHFLRPIFLGQNCLPYKRDLAYSFPIFLPLSVCLFLMGFRTLGGTQAHE